MNSEQYREYISSEEWRRRRREFIEKHSECNRCEIQREYAKELYKDDLHVHHKSYVRIGQERDSDLEALCKRCHEVESFGKSDLRTYWAPEVWNQAEYVQLKREHAEIAANNAVMTEHGLDMMCKCLICSY